MFFYVIIIILLIVSLGFLFYNKELFEKIKEKIFKRQNKKEENDIEREEIEITSFDNSEKVEEEIEEEKSLIEELEEAKNQLNDIEISLNKKKEIVEKIRNNYSFINIFDKITASVIVSIEEILSEMTLEELKIIAKDYSLSNFSRTKKENLKNSIFEKIVYKE